MSPRAFTVGEYVEEEKKPKTESVSFRIDRSTIDDLRKESKQKIESLNVLVNQIFRFHIDSHKPALLAGDIYFPKTLISTIFDVLSDEQIEEVAQDYIKGGFKEQMQMVNRKYNLSDYLAGLAHWLDVSGFPYEHEKVNGVHTVRMRFDMGKRWCIFVGRVHQIMFRNFGVENSTVEITNNTVTLTIQT
jgi:hypothetical protein